MYNDLIRELSVLESSKKQEQAIDFLSSRKGLKGKQNPDLQLSASAVVFKGKKMYFIEHPYQKELLLPAGHVEVGEKPSVTAEREFHEETGLTAVALRLIDVNLIDIPYNMVKDEKAHQHIDFRYLLKLKDEPAELAELPVFLLSKSEAPEEFKKYFLEGKQS
ncbi:NUDIX hydrolase [Lactococcus formosensis]|uniref:NUDIX hydrolase n=1 Tax=Lactococcus formosensis TaxID=1281486 RepID=UPI002435EE82|nr:NUDIX hydrolase [Lactococcus formosensis]MDG6166518.1 NUDIX hydrolase [Lactococcus formosensis]